MANEWEIKTRGTQCAVTGRNFAEGEAFYTLLYREEEGGFLREDLSVEAWKQRDKDEERARGLFSSWKSRFEVPPPPPPEAFGKKTAEELLRRYLEEEGEEHANVRYILALMLERKRLLKPIESKEEDGRRFLIYEHRETGESFVIFDPRLHLDQLEAVQGAVAELLQG